MALELGGSWPHLPPRQWLWLAVVGLFSSAFPLKKLSSLLLGLKNPVSCHVKPVANPLPKKRGSLRGKGSTLGLSSR